MGQLETVQRKYRVLASSLSERARRLWVGAEAEAIGFGGIKLVARATGMAISTVGKGRDEFLAGAPVDDLVHERRRGAGRPRLETKFPKLTVLLEKLVSPTTRGDPETALRWTIKSTRVLARELTASGHPVSAQKVSEMLRAAGYSLQGTSRMKEGEDHPDRNAQFEHIEARTAAFLRDAQPVISVDTKKKEMVGEYGRAGRDWQRKGKPVEVLTYDFPEEDGLKAIPYGIYDVGENSGFVNVGVDHDTPRFAVQSIQKWWELMGNQRYSSANKLYITADSGGSNSAVSRVWKAQLQQFADNTKLTIEVSHFPPGTSKWNKIEHRLFSFVTLNWRGRPLVSYETVVALIGATRTSKGLTVRAQIDQTRYPLGEEVANHQMAHLALGREPFHGNWNYTLSPRSPELIFQAANSLPPHKQAWARWNKLIDEQIASGLNSARFCRDRGIDYEAFISARRDLKGRIHLPSVVPKSVQLDRARWKLLIDEQAASDRNIAQFCRDRGIKYRTFIAARRQALIGAATATNE